MTSAIHPEDMHPSIAEVMEAIRELLTISRSVQPGRSTEEHQRTILEMLPALMGAKSGYAFAYPDLIDQVFVQEGLNG